MELAAILRILWRRWWIIALTVIVTAGVVTVGVSSMASTYRTTATLRVLTAVGGSPTYVDYDTDYAEQVRNTTVQIATSGPILAQIEERLELESLPTIGVEAIYDTELLRITVEGRDPETIARVADTLAALLVEQSETLYARSIPPSAEDGTTSAGETITIVDPATVPRTPSAPNKPFYLAMGLAAGVLGALLLAFALDNLDTRLHTTDAIQAATSLPILARLPAAPRGKRRRLALPGSGEQKAFRRLRAAIYPTASAAQETARHNGSGHALPAQHPPAVLLVTSARPHEGTTAAAANLAVALAHTGRSVALVDCNLWQPTLHHYFDLPNAAGLSDVLEARALLHDAIRTPDVPGVLVLTAGSPAADPARLIDSPALPPTIAALRARADAVILTSAGLRAAPDAATLAPLAEGVLFLVRRGFATRQAVEVSLQELHQVNATFVGAAVTTRPHNLTRTLRRIRRDRRSPRPIESQTPQTTPDEAQTAPESAPPAPLAEGTGR